MPLIDHPTLRDKKIPDEKGGWYWLKFHYASTPVFVEAATESGRPQGIRINSCWVDAANVDGEWGPQITRDADEKLAAIKAALQKRNQSFEELEKEIKERGLRTMDTVEKDNARLYDLEETFREEVREICS